MPMVVEDEWIGLGHALQGFYMFALGGHGSNRSEPYAWKWRHCAVTELAPNHVGKTRVALSLVSAGRTFQLHNSHDNVF